MAEPLGTTNPRAGPSRAANPMAEPTPEPRKKILCRDKQIETLRSLIIYPWENFPETVLLVGHPDTGKSMVVEHVISSLTWKNRTAWVDCSTCTSLELLLTSILDQIVRHTISSATGYMPFARCESMYAFVMALKKASRRQKPPFARKKIFIVLDHCEKLLEMDRKLLIIFSRLREFTDLRTTIIMMTNHDTQIGWFHSQPLTIRFPQYSQDELVEILCSEKPDSCTPEMYQYYVKTVVTLLHRDCRNIQRIRRQVEERLGPVLAAGAGPAVMWRNLTAGINADLAANPSGNSGTLTEAELELPFYTKFMLIAAFLASHVEPKHDSKLFAVARTSSGGRTGKRKQAPRTDISTSQLLGPRSFNVDRLFAIFYAIVGESLSLTVPLQTQVSSLVRLQLLRDSSADPLTRKLTCIAPEDFIAAIARSVEFQLEKYMGDV